LCVALSCSVPELDDRGKRCTGTCPSGLQCIDGICGGSSGTQNDARVDPDGNPIDAPDNPDGGSSGGQKDANADNDASAPLRVFITQGKYPPTQVLNACASAVNDAGLSGKYVPWLYRTDGGAPKLAGPYYLLGVDSVFVANNPIQGLSHGIDRNEKGVSLGNEADNTVWTAIYSDGTPFQSNCDDWTSGNDSVTGGVGDWTKSDGRWTAWSGVSCTNTLPGHVYCFQVQ